MNKPSHRRRATVAAASTTPQANHEMSVQKSNRKLFKNATNNNKIKASSLVSKLVAFLAGFLIWLSILVCRFSMKKSDILAMEQTRQRVLGLQKLQVHNDAASHHGGAHLQQSLPQALHQRLRRVHQKYEHQIMITKHETSPKQQLSFNRSLPATICTSLQPNNLTKGSSSQMQCQVTACGPGDNTINAPTTASGWMVPGPHYGYGFVKRDPTIRNSTRMIISGQAKAGSGCAISHKYQFLYIHVLKSGGMTLKTFLKMGLCGTVDNPCADSRKMLEIVSCRTALQQYPHYFVWSFVRNPFSRAYSSFAMALEYRHGKQHQQDLPSFSFQEYLFAHERNATRMGRPGHNRLRLASLNQRQLLAHNRNDRSPFRTSTISGKHHLERNKGNQENLQDQINRFWIDATKNITRATSTSNDASENDDDEEENPSTETGSANNNESPSAWHQQQHIRPARLSRKRKSKSTPQCTARRSLTHMSLVHCQPQSYFLFDQRHCPVFDFLGHLETFVEDLRRALTIIDSPELWDYFETNVVGDTNSSAMLKDKSTSYGSQQKQASLGGNLQHAYSDMELQQAVAKEYAQDFELLGYDSNMVPNW